MTYQFKFLDIKSPLTSFQTVPNHATPERLRRSTPHHTRKRLFEKRITLLCALREELGHQGQKKKTEMLSHMLHARFFRKTFQPFKGTAKGPNTTQQTVTGGGNRTTTFQRRHRLMPITRKASTKRRLHNKTHTELRHASTRVPHR